MTRIDFELLRPVRYLWGVIASLTEAAGRLEFERLEEGVWLPRVSTFASACCSARQASTSSVSGSSGVASTPRRFPNGNAIPIEAVTEPPTRQAPQREPAAPNAPFAVAAGLDRGRPSGGTAHVIAAAHRRLHLAVTIGTLRDVNLVPTIERQGIVHQFFSTMTTGHRTHAHSAFLARVNRHATSLLTLAMKP